MRKFIAIQTSLMLVVLFIVGGCGGGGGGDSTPSFALKTSTIRGYQPGDIWQYSVSGDDTGTGTITVQSTLVISPVTNDDCIEVNRTFLFTNSGVGNNSTFIRQDLDGSEYVFGGWNPDDGYNWIVSAPGYELDRISPVAVGQTFNGTMTYQDGTVATHSYSVTGMEYVSTGIGSFEAYKITCSGTTDYNDVFGSRSNYINTVWFVPGLSANVKEDFFITYFQFGSQTGTRHLIATLESTNIIY